MASLAGTVLASPVDLPGPSTAPSHSTGSSTTSTTSSSTRSISSSSSAAGSGCVSMDSSGMDRASQSSGQTDPSLTSSSGTAGSSISSTTASTSIGSGKSSEDAESEMLSSLAGLTLGKLRLRQKQEAKSFRQEWDSKLKRAKGSSKRQIKREMKIKQSEMIDRHKKEETLLKGGAKSTSSMTVTSSSTSADSASLSAGGTSSSSSRRRRKKHESALEREAMLRAVEQSEEVLAADGGMAEEESEDRRSQENRLFRRMLQPLGLRIHEVAADGHCLFESLCQQLRLVGIPDSDSDIKCADLRRLAADFMRSHKEMFLPFLLNDSGSPMNDSDFNEYCMGIAGMDSMSGDGKSMPRVLWGGHHEIVAISRALNVSIVVYSVSSEPLLISADRSETISKQESVRNKNWLRISFHQHMYSMGEHYNSVAPL